MQETWISSLIAAGAALLGALVGGLSTYLATSKIERDKWASRKSDELRHDRRQALTAMMEWITPLERAVEKARTLASPYRQKMPGESPADLIDSWPKPLDELSALDLGPAPRALVPDQLYMRAVPIINLLEHLQVLAITADEARSTMEYEKRKPPDELGEAFVRDAGQDLSELRGEILTTTDDIANRLQQFKTDAAAAYRATYE